VTITRGLVIGAAQEEEDPVAAGSSEAGSFGIWEERLQTPEIIRSFTMTEADILDHNPLDSPLVQYSNYGVIPSEDPNGVAAYVDTPMKALRFDIPSLTGADSAGSFFANFSEDLSVQIGENEEVYVQVRVRWDADLFNTFFYANVATLEKQLGIKFFDINGGDVSGGPEPDPYRNISHLYSSAQQKVVVQTYEQFRLLHAYGYNPVGGANDILDEEITGDFLWQNEYLGGLTCNYVDSSTNPDRDGPDVPEHTGCWNMVADEWVTLMLHCSLGPRLVNGNDSSQWTERQTRLFAARDGEPFTLLFDFNSTTPGYFDHLIAGSSDTQWNNAKLGKVWLFPYMTAKDNTQVHAQGTAWYKELLIGRTQFAAPMTLAANAPAVGKWREISGANTMRDVNGADTSNQALLTVLDNWNSSVYARHVGPYGMVINAGSGHCNLNDIILGQALANADADCEWDDLFPRSALAAFSANDGAGSDPYGGINGDTSPVPPHTYDNLVYIPPSVFGNEKGALCHAILAAVACASPVARKYAWFLDLDNAGTVSPSTPCTWSRSTNALPENCLSGFFQSSAVYDPERECVWFLAVGAVTHIGKLFKNGANWEWTSVAHDNPSLNTDALLTGGYCPTLDCVVWFWHGGPKVIVWKPNEAGDDGTLYHDATQSGTAPANVCGLEWCPHASVQKFYGLEYNGSTYYPTSAGNVTMKTLTPPASLPGTWTWGSETVAAEGGATVLGNDSIQPRFNALRWAWPFMSFVWANRIDGKTNLLRPLAATSIDEA
jgi:hypothetical protein